MRTQVRFSMYSTFTLFILIDYPIINDTISMGYSLLYLRGHRSNFLNYDAFMSLKIVFILSNSTDSDEMAHYVHYVAFHLCLHCFPKYSFRGFQSPKVKCTTVNI